MKWEYLIHIVDNDGDDFDRFSIDDLNLLGEEGWELLHVNQLQATTKADETSNSELIRTKRVALWFKRQKKDQTG